MASNGYIRRDCKNCLFYLSDIDGSRCTLWGDIWAQWLHWISASDYENNPKMKEKYDEKCEHYVDIRTLKNQYREKFGVPKIEYGN